MNTNAAGTPNEIDMLDILAGKVRAGEPLHVKMPVSEPLLQIHMQTVRRLQAETGMPVHVIYS